MKSPLFFAALICSLFCCFSPAYAQNMQYVSNSLVQVATTTVEAGTNNNPILRLAITVSGTNNPLILSEIRLGIPAANPWIRRVRVLYTGDSNQFSESASGLGSIITDPNTNEWVLQTDFPLFPVTTQYFWVTYDMSLCTPSSTVVDGTLNSFKLGGVNRTPSNPNPSGQATSTVPQNPRFVSIGNGYWHFGNNWENGEVPCDNTTIPVVINSNIEVITNVQIGNRITVNLGKTLKVNGGELVLGNGNTDTRLFLDGKVRVENGVFHVRGNTSSVNSSQLEITGGVFRSGDAGGDNKDLILSSTVNITGGKLEANGSLTFAALSELTMSAGEIVVDPNGGSAGKSSSSGLGINVLPNLSGGTITIVDPLFNGTGEVYSYNGPVGAAFGGTLIIGGTTGTNTSTSSVGFEVFGGNMPVNNLIINGGRKSNFRHTSFDGRFYAGNVTINSGKELEMLSSGELVTGTALVNNGICSACALSFASVSTVTSLPNPASNAQTLSGTGFFKISAADPDPTNQADNKIRHLFVNHAQASPGLTVHMPLTVTEDFWPEGGKTTLTGNHLLTIGESASNPGIVNDATRSDGAFPTGWVTTALRRWTKTAGVPTGYNEAAIFPVGDTERRRHFYLSHPSGVATPGTLTVQFVTEDPGISGFPLNWGGKLMVSASPTGYWKVTNNGVSGTYNVMGNGNGFQNRTGDNIGFTEEMSVMRRTNGVWAAAEGEPKLPTGLDRLRSEGFSTYGDYGISGTAVLFNTPKTYSSLATAQPQTAAIDAGSSFISVVRVDVEVFGTQNNLQMTELVFNTNGTTNTFDLRNARAYYTGTSPDFTNTTPFGNVIANPNGTITFTGSQELTGGNVMTKNYFWLAYDIRYCAPTGNVVDGELVSIKVGATTYTPVNGNPGPGRSVNAFGLFNYQTVADGNWNNFDIWDDGCIPRNVTNAVAIGHNVTVTGNAETDGTVTLQAGKKLTIATGGTLTVGLPGGDNNLFLTQTGSTVEIAGGTFNLNGSISFVGATFAMSAGNFNIDPNNGTSGVSGGTVLNFPSTATLNVTGGNITLVDPPFGTGSYSLGFLSGTILFNLNATLTLGGSTGVNTSANADGFRINTGSTTRGLAFANVVVNGGRKSDNRQVWVDGGYLYCGNLTVNAGCELEMRDGGSASEVAVSGNLVNNGVVSIPSNRRLVFHGGLTVNPLVYQNATTGHTLSGTGLFKLLASDPDPAQQTNQQLGQLAVYNTTASPGLNCQMPLIVANTLRLSAGRINLIAPNRLRLGTVAGGGTLADLAATGWVNGPFQRWTKAAGTAYGLTDNFGYFPVGDALARCLIQVAFPSGGPTASGVLSAQFNNTLPGTAGLPITWGGVSVSGTSATGFWQIGSEGASGAYTARADATGFADCSGAALSTPGSVRLIKRPNSGAWSAAEGSANTPAALNAVEGTGFSTFSEFGIGLNQGLTANCKNIAVSLSGSSVSVAASDLNNNSAGCGSLSFSVAGQNTISFNCSQVGAPQSITLTVTDGQSNTTATCQATVTVTENVPPTIACPPNTTVAAGPSCTGQVGAYTLLSKSDNCTASGSIAEEPQSPAATTVLSGHNTAQTVTLTANDGNGNTQTCQFTVTLKDVTKPTIACPANTTVAAGPSCMGQVGAYALLSKSDNCTASGGIAEEPQSPAATTPLSGHNTAQTVTLTANDGNGNTQTCQFTVTLKDVTKPTIACPANTTVAAGPSCMGQVGSYTLLSKSDNCTASGSIVEEPQSPAATTVLSGHNTAQTVTLTANDGNGNTQTCQFTVTLKDVTKPTITCPANTTVAAGPSCTGQVGAYTLLSKSDNCTASGSIVEEPQSPAATTVLSGHNTAQTVTLTANDGNGNTQTCQFTVTLKDVTKPTITCPANTTVAAGPSCMGQVGAYTLLSKSDNCTASGSIAEEPQSPAATTVLSGHNTAQTVTLTANDGNGNTQTCQFTVTLKDVTKPTIACPANTTVAAGPSCTGQVGAYALLSKSDNCTASGSIVEEPQSPAATTLLSGHNTAQTVTLTANDGNGNTQTCQFTVTLKDVTKPTITCPANTTVAAGPSCTGQVGAYTLLSKSDNCTASGSIVEEPQSPDATTVLSGHNTAQTVTLTANDGNGNTQTCQFTVTLKDVTKPTVACPDNTITINTNAGSSCEITIPDYITSLTATDNCSAVVEAQSIPAGAYTTGVSDGATITVNYTATDGATPANTTTCTVIITVNDDDKPTFTCPTPTLVLNTTGGENCQVVIPNLVALVTDAADNCALKTTNPITQSIAAGNYNGVSDGMTIPVVVTVTDNASPANSETCTINFTVNDDDKPTFTCPTPTLVLNTTGGENCQVVIPDLVALVTSAADNCALKTTNPITQSVAAGNYNGVSDGMTIPVVVTVTDNASPANSETCTINFTVNDDDKPTFTCPTPTLVLNTTGGENCQVVIPDLVALVTSAADNCALKTTNPITQSVAAGNYNGVSDGMTIPVVVTVTDNASPANSETCTINFTVNDDDKPTFTCPTPTLVLNTTGGENCQVVIPDLVALVTNAADNCTLKTTNPITQNVAAGNYNGVSDGMTIPVVVTVTDNASPANSETCTITFTVNDDDKPTFTCPTPTLVLNTTGGENCQVVIPNLVALVTDAADNCALKTTNPITQSVAAGNYNGVSDGMTIPVVVTVTDNASPANSETCTINFTVNDDDKPTFTCPTPTLVLNTTGGENCQVTIPNLVAMVTDANDNCALKTTNPITQSIAAGNYNGVSDGMTIPVVVTVTDNASPANSETCTINFTVNDDDKPTFTCPTPTLVLNTTGGENCQVAIPDLVALVTDAADNCALKTTNPITQSVAAGNYNGVSDGMTIPFVVTVTDNASPANSETCTINFTVNDDDAPTVLCPPNTTILNTITGNTCAISIPNYVAMLSPTDNCAASSSIVEAQDIPAGAYSTGIYHGAVVTVNYTATDGASPANTATCTVSITVNAPEAEVRGNGVAIADGDNNPDLLDHTNFGDTFPNTNLTRTFTVQNTGGLPLTVSSIVSSDNVNFMVGALSVNPIPAGQSATFDVTFNAAAPGIYPSTLTINNNDCNEGMYDFAIVAEITCSIPAFSPCLGPQTANTAAGLCSAVVTYTPTVTGIPAPTLTYVFTGATVGSGSGTGSGSTFNKGVTNVVITAANVCGSITCSFTVTVTDNQDPTIVCPNAISRTTDPNQCTSVVTYAPTVSDNCSGATFILVSGPASGTAFPKGSTSVTLKAVDAAGRMSGNCMFSVTVNDNQPPSITCPANLIRSTDANTCGAVVAYTNPTYSDNCPLDGPAGLDHLMGGLSNSTFPKGITAITWQATDGAGLTKTCSFTITVNDTQKPNITCPANQTRSTDPGMCSAIVTYPTPKGTDNCGLPAGQPMWISGGTNASGSTATFQKGITNVTWRATDGAGNTQTCTFRVTVNDTEAPTMTCPAAMSLSTTTNTCSAIATYTNPTFTDNCAPTTGTATRVSGLVSGSTFPLGNSNVVFQATDAAGNTRRCTMVITVTDNQPPVITCPAPVVATGIGTPCRATVFYGSTTAYDNCAGTLTPFLVTGLASGSQFSVGVTTNTFRAVAPNGQSSECSFSVTVDCGSGMGNNGVEVRDADWSVQRGTHLDLILAPNPALSTVTVSIEGVGAGGGTLLVYDAVGRLIMRQVIAENQRTAVFQVDGAEFAPGMYRVNLRTENGMVTKTLVVVKQ